LKFIEKGHKVHNHDDVPRPRDEHQEQGQEIMDEIVQALQIRQAGASSSHGWGKRLNKDMVPLKVILSGVWPREMPGQESKRKIGNSVLTSLSESVS
jgi:hypothetical protein